MAKEARANKVETVLASHISMLISTNLVAFYFLWKLEERSHICMIQDLPAHGHVKSLIRVKVTYRSLCLGFSGETQSGHFMAVDHSSLTT